MNSQITVYSSQGYAIIDRNGNIIENQLKDDDYQHITKFDTKKYFDTYGIPIIIDILLIGYWLDNGNYEEPIPYSEVYGDNDINDLVIHR